MPRVTLQDNFMDVMYKMSEGNPGAVSVLMQLYKEVPNIDPQNIMGGIGAILDLDTLGVYGPRIWMLYKDVCGEDIAKTNWMLRAWQLGIISEDELNKRIDNYGRDGVDGIIEKVMTQLSYYGEGKSE
ncbi:MAG: hypothetical protein WDA59_01760 [Methanofastidiosum sp.]